MSRLHAFDLMLCDYLRYNLRRHLGDVQLARCIGHMGDGFRDYFGIKLTVVSVQGSEPTARPEDSQVDAAQTVSAETPGVELKSAQTPPIESREAESPVADAGDAQAGATTSGDDQASAADTEVAQAPATKIEVEVVPAPDRNVSFLLSDIELERLETIVASLVRFKSWRASRTVHESYHFCTGEINRRISPFDADCWAKKSRKFVRQLERKRLSLEEGIAIVRDWVDELRRCLGVMDETDLLPAPHGGFPTPTHPNPARRVAASSHKVPMTEPMYMEVMREAMKRHEKGAYASKKSLLILAAEQGLNNGVGVNRENGLRALDTLADLGEYHGHKKSKVTRRTTDSSTAQVPPIADPSHDNSDSSAPPNG